jgi:diguanylate cyclase (GGDEF)-like protein
MTRGARLGIHGWILLAALLAAVPVLVFSGLLIKQIVDGKRADEEAVLVQRANAAAVAVQRRFETATAALRVLADSDAARKRDWPQLYAQAQRTLTVQPDALAISLTSPSGDILFSTLSPYGTKLPVSSTAASEETVFTQGRIVLSPLARGAISNRLMMQVSVPVRIDGEVRYALRMALPATAFNAVLEDQGWPAGWIGAVIDSQGVIAGRTSDRERLVGQPAPESLTRAIREGRTGAFNSLVRDGAAVRTVISPVPSTDWTVALGIPLAVLQGERDDTLRLLVLGSLGCVLLGAVAAWLIANAVRRQVGALARVAQGGSEAARSTLQRSPIREVAEVTGMIATVVGREDALAKRLQKARHDALTGLPGRELFRELSLREIQRARALGHAVAVLYLDLDGFKPINDRLGHRAGDTVLCEVAEVIRRTVRGEDIAGRLGGDEFVVCLSAPMQQIEAVAGAVAERLIGEVATLGHGLGCSVGIAYGRAAAVDLESLVAGSDAAMLRAKTGGKNAYVFARPQRVASPAV